MRNRWIWFSLCALLGVLLIACAWMIPVYLWAIDARVVQKAGKRTPTLVDRGVQLVKENKLGAAEMLLQTAREQGIADRGELGLAVTNLAAEHPGWQVWGGGGRHLEVLFGSARRPPRASINPSPSQPDGEKDKIGAVHAPESVSDPLTEWVVRLENRGKVLELLHVSCRPVVLVLLLCRSLTNPVIFRPSLSSSGQAFDAALSVCGLLLSEGQVTNSLSGAISALAAEANRGGNTQPLEEVLLSFMSLGQRLNWGQLAEFVGPIENEQTLRLLANIVRRSEEQLPVLYSAVELSGKPAAVARYLMEYSRTGLQDLGSSLRFGAGGINELLQRQERLYNKAFRQHAGGNTLLGAFSDFAVDYAWRMPGVALGVKWSLYLAGGFLLAVALHFARPRVTALEAPLEVRGFHLAREFLFALGFLVVVLLLSEPFLAQESQKAEFAFRLRLPTVGTAVTAGMTRVKSSFMDPKSLLTLLLFFVLQALIYTACLVKLAEIRRQRVLPRMKLKLLENEDHLFDAGLYLGFAGTIISLILVSLGMIKPSLMAAYSSTSFGIIFVSIFKIFHLRPERRKLLLEADVEPPAPVAPTAARPLAAPL
jgi:hypothetical protein